MDSRICTFPSLARSRHSSRGRIGRNNRCEWSAGMCVICAGDKRVLWITLNGGGEINYGSKMRCVVALLYHVITQRWVRVALTHLFVHRRWMVRDCFIGDSNCTSFLGVLYVLSITDWYLPSECYCAPWYHFDSHIFQYCINRYLSELYIFYTYYWMSKCTRNFINSCETHDH